MLDYPVGYLREVITALIIALLAVFLATHAASLMAVGNDEMPREWFGKRKVVDRFGEITRIAVIHYLVDVGDPDNDGSQDGYELMGIRWDLSKYPSGVPYIINPSGGIAHGLDASSVISEIKEAMEVWDQAVDLNDYVPPYNTVYGVELFSNTPQINYNAKASTNKPDHRNVITWGRAQKGVIAYAVIWYVTSTGEIVDADIVLNSYYRWGIADGNEGTADLSGKFDIRNIVTHEAGHICGLADLYDNKYSAMTMYGYSKYGEELKRSLEPGDIAGVQKVYDYYRKNKT